MATCGDKSLLKTFDGRDADNPCGPKFGVLDYCNHVDVEIWVGKVEELNSALLNAWNQLMRRENERQDWTQTNKFRGWYDDILARQGELLEVPLSEVVTVPGAGAPQRHVARLVALGIDQICLVEQMRDAFIAMGGDPVKVPNIVRAPRKSVVDNLVGFAPNPIVASSVNKVIVGATVIGALYVFREPIARAIAGGRR